METLVRGYIPADGPRFYQQWGIRAKLVDAASLGIVVNARAFRQISNDVGLVYPMFINDSNPTPGSLIELYLKPTTPENQLVEVVINSSAVRATMAYQTPKYYAAAINPHIRNLFYRAGIKHLFDRSISHPSEASANLVGVFSLSSAMLFRSDNRKVNYTVPAYEACTRG